MKKATQLMIVLAIVFLTMVVVFGQSKPIDPEAYQNKVVSAIDGLRGKTYRSTTISETLADRDSKSVKKSKRIYEILPPDRTRLILESDEERKEIIQIGQRRFVRINDGEWKE